MQEPEQLFIVRHAQSAANAGGRTIDTAAVPITDLGLRQAECVAGLIPQRPSFVAVSRYLRTLESAAPLLRRYPNVPVEQWRIEEFTYLNIAACAGTTYGERRTLRDVYWKRNDPAWVDGPGCESFSDLVARARHFEEALNALPASETAVFFTHGLFMQALLWLQQKNFVRVTEIQMAEFDTFRRTVPAPNCSVLRAAPNEHGRLQLTPNVSVDHLPVDLRTG